MCTAALESSIISPSHIPSSHESWTKLFNGSGASSSYFARIASVKTKVRSLSPFNLGTFGMLWMRFQRRAIRRALRIQQQERMRNLLDLPWDACVHSGRHTALTNLGLTGADLFTLQRAAGHASITTTRKYVHPTPAALKDAFQNKTKGERSDRRKASRKRTGKCGCSARGSGAGGSYRWTWGLGDGNLGDSRGLKVAERYFPLPARADDGMPENASRPHKHWLCKGIRW